MQLQRKTCSHSGKAAFGMSPVCCWRAKLWKGSQRQEPVGAQSFTHSFKQRLYETPNSLHKLPMEGTVQASLRVPFAPKSQLNCAFIKLLYVHA